jgi:signal transduction histidine kinase
MFNEAKLKLTVWYVLTIMTVSFIFSAIIYVGLAGEIHRLAESQRQRFERWIREGIPFSFIPGPNNISVYLADPAIEQHAIYRLQLILLFMNVVIFSISTVLSYILAGQTLQPIQTMVEEQRRFISDASHELRTPLTAIKTTFEVALRDDKLKLSQARELIKDNLEEIDQLQQLTDNLLKLSAGSLPLRPGIKRKVDLLKIVESALKKTAPLAHQKDLTTITSLNAMTVLGNAKELNELIVILTDNAIKYSPTGKNITVQLTQYLKSARLSIKDEGVGIPAKDLAHIFDRFYRVDQSRSKLNTHGYGLGLSRAKQIAENHNGKLTVKSQPDQGSTFTLTLPIA